jgi:hypothetical protein
MTAVQPFDFSPLVAPVDRAAVATLRRQSIADKVPPAANDDLFLFWVSVVGFVVASALLAFIDIGSISLVAKIAYTAGMGSVDLVFVVGIVFGLYRLSVRWTQFFRAKQFAELNGMTYAASEMKPTWDSTLFNRSAVKSHASNVFTATSEPVFEAGNYVYENWADKKLIVTEWGYAVADLGRVTAPFVLRSNSRRSARRLGGGAYTSNPILSIGSFADRQFRLYCPAGAEDDARRLFTSELIGGLQKMGRTIDVEVKGQFLFIYSSRRFAFPRPAVVRAVFAVIGLVTAPTRTP